MTETIRFYPSHMTKGLVGATVAMLAGAYALREFSLATREEVQALLNAPK